MRRAYALNFSVTFTGGIFMLRDNAKILLKVGDIFVRQCANYVCSKFGCAAHILEFMLVDEVEGWKAGLVQNKSFTRQQWLIKNQLNTSSSSFNPVIPRTT